MEDKNQTKDQRIKGLQLFIDLINQTDDALFIVDPETSRFLDFNNSACRTLGYTRKELLNMKVPDICSGITDPTIWNNKVKDAKEKENLILEGDQRRKDGGTFPVELNVKYVMQGENDYLLVIARDITERKKVEEALSDSEKRFKMLAEESPNMIFINKGGRVVYANKMCEEMMGYTREEYYSESFNFMDLIAPEYKDLVKENFKIHMSGKDIPPYDYKCITRDGREITTIIATKLIDYEDGKAILGIITDITERKITEEKIRKISNEWEVTFNSINDLLSIHDKDFNIIRVNKAFSEALGKRSDELIGKKCYEVIHGTNELWPNCPLKQTLKTGKSVTEEFYEPGLGIYLQASTSPVFDEKGGIVGTIHIAKDITDRKQAEESIKKSEERYRRITGAVTDYIYTVHVEAGTTKNTTHSEACFAVTGYTSQEFAADPYLWIRMVVGDDHDLVRKQAEDILSGHSPQPVEHRIVRKDGDVRWVESTVVPHCDMDGNLISYDGLIRDITDRKDAEEELQRTFKELRGLESIINRSPAMVFLWPIQEGWPVEFVSDNVKEVLGYTAKDFISGNVSWPGITHHDDVPRLEAEVAEYLEEGITEFNQEYRLITKSGNIRWMRDRNKVLLSSNGEATHIQSIVLDVTEHKEAEQSLLLTQFSIDRVADAIYWMGQDARFFYVNNEACHSLGYSREELLSMSVHDIDTNFPQEPWTEHWKKLKQRGSLTIESNHRTKDGRTFPVEITANYLEFDGKEYNCAFARNITERKQTDEKLKQQAFYDQLTNLQNRTMFTKHLRRVIERPKRHMNYLFAVLFMDLDRFKVINDSLGHIIGDKLLVAVARRLEACVRPNDSVARFGGDEFAILLDDIKNVSDATCVADRIQKELSLPFNLRGHEVFTSASIGIALSATGYDREEDILRDADSAMYRAKAIGKARYEIFDTEIHTSAMEILQLEVDLRRAVERNEFLVYYQPVVSLTDARIVGVEALLRWQHPNRGFIPPMEFIPLAEETGLISTIGEWILRKACAQNKVWQDAGYKHLIINVNLSARQFHYHDIPELIGRVLQETGLAAQSLNIEITESIAMEARSIKILNELTAMGVQTAIDDFGTGYSSLGSLKSFPINAIKIDKTFIKDVTSDTNAGSIVRAIIAMAHSLKMNLCDEAQGYIFSPPIPEEEFTELLKEGLSFLPVNPDEPKATDKTRIY
jgi:diguanylate cyclase (GGDEF)-like protein/PAS domain S-box-containing protein